jgi:RNA ligase
MDKNKTYICELIGSENKHIIDYGGELRLILISIIDRCNFTEEVDYEQLVRCSEEFGFGIPKKYNFDNLINASTTAKKLDVNQEGFVAVYDNGVRLKCKGEAFCRMHGILNRFTPLAVWECYANGDDELNEFKASIPNEMWDTYDRWVGVFDGNLKLITGRIKRTYRETKHLSDRDLGMFLVRSNNPYNKWVFMLRKHEGDMDAVLSNMDNRLKLCKIFRPKNNEIINLKN